jgi:hypothetical protein
MNQNDTISTVEATAPETFKIVINTCFGGFSLTSVAEALYRLESNIPDDRYIFWSEEYRADPILIRIIEKMGDKANGRNAHLKVVEVPMWLQEKGWHIDEYDGVECVAENHQTWC